MLIFDKEAKRFEIRTRPKLIHSTTGTRDMQPVELSLRILYRPKEDKLKEILDNQGLDYDDRVIPSIGNEVLKSVVAQYYADQLLTQREKIYADIKEGMTQRAHEFNMELDDVSITSLQFSRDYAQSIEKKQVA
jgi:prohibitin 1